MTATKRPRLLSVLVSSVAALWALPLLWVVLLSLKPNELLRGEPGAALLPYPLTLDNYLTLLRVSQTPRWLLNSLIVAGTITLLTLVLSTLAGYALARIPFRGRPVLVVLILAGLTIPGHAVLLPLHALFADWNLHNTYLALVTPSLAVPFGVMVMRQFFSAVPRELEEAAQLDHAGRLTVFLRIMLPLSRPALTTVGVFTFLAAWNDFFWPLVSATDQDAYTITIGLASLQGNFAQSEGLGFIMATAVFGSLPVVAVYMFFQRAFVQGIALGGGK